MTATTNDDLQKEAALKVIRLAMELSIAWEAASEAGVPMVIEVDEIPLGKAGRTVKQVLARLLVP
ncbi:hypothetical protein ABID26_004071 [Mesorhizobium shonense]|uniref:Uncharacterized protein n=1 Tax=Mesorhizobium shonense TaxID=1209948 RepID=A0ABV2HWG5_9HYPH